MEWIKDYVRDKFVSDECRKMIIWCKFTREIERMHEELSRIMSKDTVKIVYGKTKDLEDIKESFNTKAPGEIQIIVAQIKKLAYGHNLQGCDVNVYFSHSWSYIERAQSEDRSHRMGRVGAVQYYELEYIDTIDASILRAVERKKDVSLRLSPVTISREENNG